jgi:hypothetical protein
MQIDFSGGPDGVDALNNNWFTGVKGNLITSIREIC